MVRILAAQIVNDVKPTKFRHPLGRALDPIAAVEFPRITQHLSAPQRPAEQHETMTPRVPGESLAIANARTVRGLNPSPRLVRCTDIQYRRRQPVFPGVVKVERAVRRAGRG